MTDSTPTCKTRIHSIQITDDCLTDRAGLALFARYVSCLPVLHQLVHKCFGSIRKSAKGLPVQDIFQQLLCFFMDGTSFHLTRFDELRGQRGYAACIETSRQRLLSSHQVKRFFGAFDFARNFLFNRIHHWFLGTSEFIENASHAILRTSHPTSSM